MRVSQVTGHEHLMRLDLLEQLAHNRTIGLGKRPFLDRAGLVERQIEEVDMLGRQSHVSAGSCGLTAADEGFEVEHLAGVLIAHLDIAEEMHILVILSRHIRVLEQPELVVALEKIEESYHLVITHGDTSAGLVSHMHIMSLFDQSCKGASHRYHIVVGVRREDQHILRIGLSAFGAIRVIGIRLAAGPSGDGMLEVVEDLDVTVVGRLKAGDQFGQTVVVIVLVGEFEYRLAGLSAEPYHCPSDELVVPLARGDHPGRSDTCQSCRSAQIEHAAHVLMQL